MKTLTLNRGRYEILIDDEDYWDIIEGHWGVVKSGKGMYLQVRITSRGHSIVYLKNYIMCPNEDQAVIFTSDNRLDFRKENLQIVTKAQEMQRRNFGVGNSSRYRGVYIIKNTYCSKIKSIYLGCYKKEIHAARAYDIVAKEMFGNDAAHNNIPESVIPVRGRQNKTRKT